MSVEADVGTRVLQVERSEQLIELFGSPEEAAAKAKEALVLELLREARISQGQAARLLGLTRWEMLDLVARYQVPSGPETSEELEQEVEALRRFVQGPPKRGDRQY